jgi:hypothetical protein
MFLGADRLSYSLVLFILDVVTMATVVVRQRRFLVAVCKNNACSLAESGVVGTSPSLEPDMRCSYTHPKGGGVST